MNTIYGIVFKIQRFSIHDGPGIRTAVFLKGCPLHCWWCHNPEGQESGVRIYHRADKCLSCGRCVALCLASAILISNEGLSIERSRCNNCFRCVDDCPTNAMEMVGKIMNIVDIMKEIDKDIIFYEEMGGVTFTGGEPFLQFDFLYEFLIACKEKEIHTVVETSGLTQWDNIKKASSYIDLFYFDIKLIDANMHKKYTGLSNKAIISNLIRLSRIHDNVCVRVPIIPGITDNHENIKKICKLLKIAGIKSVEVLTYHSFGEYKYNLIGTEYKLKGIRGLEEDKILGIKQYFLNSGINVKIKE